MAYKSVLTVLTQPDDAGDLLGAAIGFAAAQGAHLDMLCFGIDGTQTGYYFAGATAIVQTAGAERASQEAKEIEAKARAALDGSEIAWGIEAVVAQPVGLTDLVARRARFADIVILPQPYGPTRANDEAVVVESAVFPGHAPVLVLPPGPQDIATPKRIVVAWNEADEALAAIRSALPLLTNADLVDICMVAPSRHPSGTTDPGSEMSKLLVRHGVPAQVSIVAQTLPRVSEVLARHATDIGADLLVMGAYGHSRLREAILGGATRNLLENAPLATFLAR